MIRGTTPTLEFELPFEVSSLKSAYITLSQSDQVIVNKDLSECTLDTNTLKIKLTQKDTLAFTTDDPIQIQIRVLDTHGNALASEIWTDYAEDVLYEGIMK